MREMPLPFEPAGNHYHELLVFLASWVRFASLVVKPVGRPVDSQAYASLLERLESFRVADRFIDVSDGTIPTRPRLLFRYDSDSIDLIQQTASCLFSWQTPYLPEDLTLYRKDRSLLLGSIGHEYDAWLVLDDGEQQKLAAHFAHVKQGAPPEVAFGADRVTIAGGAGTLLTFARRLREPPTPGVLVLTKIDGSTARVEIRVEPGDTSCTDGSWIGREGDLVIISGDSVDLDILAGEILTFVAEACSPAKTRNRVILQPYEGHPYLRADALALEVVLDS